MAFRKASFLVVLSAGTVLSAGAAEYFVATNGSDAYSGTSAGAPFATVQWAVSKANPGDTVYIRGGTYRESVWLSNTWASATDCICIFNYSNESPTIKGSDVITNWVLHTNAIWKVTNWAHNTQQVFVDGMNLQQIGWPNEWMASNSWWYTPVGHGYGDMTNGTFYCDRTNQDLFVWLGDGTAPTAHVLEVSMRPFILNADPSVTNQHFHLRGLRFAHCNTLEIEEFARCGVALYDNALIEDCRIQWCDTGGLLVGDGARVVRCDISGNGHVGMTMQIPSSNWVVAGCTILSNNYRGFMENQQAAGIKNNGPATGPGVSGTICSNEIAWNHGPGVWFDTCRNNGGPIIVSHNYIHDNTTTPRNPQNMGSFGVFMEVSKDALVFNNIIARNLGPGIFISASDRIRCYNNVLVGNRGWTDSSAVELAGLPRDVPFSNPVEHATLVSNEFVNNIVYENPVYYQITIHARGMTSTGFVQGNVIDYNCYYNTNGQTWFDECTGKYTTASAFEDWRTATGYDTHSISTNPGLAGFRLMHGSVCVDRGTTSAGGVVTDDCWGSARPIDGDLDGTNEFDLGASEYDPWTTDSDGDAQFDVEEIIAGTNPTNSAAFFSVRGAPAGPPAPGFVVAWQGVTGRVYTLSSCTDMPSPAWTNISGAVSLPGTEGPMSVTDAVAGAEFRYYRIGVKRP